MPYLCTLTIFLAAGQMCLLGFCVPRPESEYVTIGNRASTVKQCISGKLNGKYCQGVPVGGACDASDQKKACDVGLYCNGGVCANQVADGADCKPGQCQSSSLCYADNKCKRWHTLDKGTPAPDAKMCKSGFMFSGLCADRPSVDKEWINNTTDPTMACVYSNTMKLPAMCVMYSADPNRAGYCMNLSAINFGPYLDFINKYTPGSCPEKDPFCDKAADAYGCPKFIEVMKTNLAQLLDMEKPYPDCEEKLITRAINEYKCFAKELMWGLLTLLAIVLLI